MNIRPRHLTRKLTEHRDETRQDCCFIIHFSCSPTFFVSFFFSSTVGACGLQKIDFPQHEGIQHHTSIGPLCFPSCTPRVVPNVGGLRAWPIDRCSDKDTGRSQRTTPTPCERTDSLCKTAIQDSFFFRNAQKNIPGGNLFSDLFRMTLCRATMRFGSFRFVFCFMIIMTFLPMLSHVSNMFPSKCTHDANAVPSPGTSPEWAREEGCFSNCFEQVCDHKAVVCVRASIASAVFVLWCCTAGSSGRPRCRLFCRESHILCCDSPVSALLWCARKLMCFAHTDIFFVLRCADAPTWQQQGSATSCGPHVVGPAKKTRQAQ